MTDPVIGATYQKKMTVTKELFASTVGSGTLDVLATPMVVALMEGAAAELSNQYLDSNFTTVGIKINVNHLRPSVEGMHITAVATFAAVNGKKHSFSIEAFDEKGLIATAEHDRFVVESEVFFKNAIARAKEKV